MGIDWVLKPFLMQQPRSWWLLGLLGDCTHSSIISTMSSFLQPHRRDAFCARLPSPAVTASFILSGHIRITFVFDTAVAQCINTAGCRWGPNTGYMYFGPLSRY